MNKMINDTICITALKCEYLFNPVGIDIKKPRFGWEILSSRRGTMQKAYQVLIAGEEADLDKGEDIVWDSGKVLSGNSVNVEYEGPELKSRLRYYWKVRIWDETDAVSGWSYKTFWEMGLLDEADWEAIWVEPIQECTTMEPALNTFQKLAPVPPDFVRDYSLLKPCQFLRRTFESQKAVKQARIYATAHGVYELELNGCRVGNQELAPEVSAYDKYLQYQTYEVTSLINDGANAVGAVLGDGWYSGRIGLPGDSCQYGNKLALLLQLEIEYQDGSRLVVVSDDNFKSSAGPLIFSDLFIGERYDARLEKEGWSTAAYDDSNWLEVDTADYGYSGLVAQHGEPVRVIEEIKPVCIITTPKGETVVDLGQNIAGRIRMHVCGAAGTEVKLEYSEVLDAEGNFLMNILGRNKDQKDFYVLKGEGEEVYEQFFTFHGFRYVRVTGYPGELSVDRFTGLVLASDLRLSGSFECSDELINRLQKNIVWSQKGNMLSIPTDCPQRERAGFTGDAQVFISTACFNMDVDAFFTRWLRNLVLEQKEDGQVPIIVPYWKSYDETFFPIQGSHTSAGWGDACIIVPWVLFNMYGDKRILEENYNTMIKWVSYIKKEAEEGIPQNMEGELTPERRERQKYLWNTGFHFGDWLVPSLTAGYKNPFEAANATKELIACCFYAYCTELLAKIAQELGKMEDMKLYSEINENIRKAFTDEYLKEDGSFKSHFQGIYVLALKMKMIPDEMLGRVTDQLISLIKQNGFRLDTGFVSIPYLMDVLCDNGRKDIAYKLLYQTECPSWLYEVEKGATTIWETWDAITPDGKVNIASFNHYAFGCIGDWLYRYVAGLDKDKPGYRHIVIKPEPDNKLTYVKAGYHSIYGEILLEWKLEGCKMNLHVKIPPNTTASIWIPGVAAEEITENGVKVSECADIYSCAQKGDKLVLEIGSGEYVFIIQ